MKGTFLIPTYKKMEEFFTQKPHHQLSEGIEKMLDFFHHQISSAIDQNITQERLHLCGTLILMISPEKFQDYCLTRDTFGLNPKRRPLAKTIQAIMSQNMHDLNDLIDQTNPDIAKLSQRLIFDHVGPCSDDETKIMKEFCTDYVIQLASDISSLFSAAENKTWRLSGLPTLNSLRHHPNQRQEMLCNETEEHHDRPEQIASNPYGYNLRSRGQKRTLA